MIDVVEPFFKVIVELGYDRSIPPWEPTPARLIPPLDPATVAADLVDAIGEGITNAAALIGSPTPLSIPAAPATADQDAAVAQVLSAPQTTRTGSPATICGAPAHGRSRAGDDQGPAQRSHRCGEVGHRRRAHDRAVRRQ